MKKLEKLKSISAFVFGLLLCLSPFSSLAMAEGDKNYSEEQKQQIKDFCFDLWDKAKKEVFKPAMFTGDLLPYVQKAVNTANDYGLDFRVEYIRFGDGTGYYVTLLYMGRYVSVCDYYTIVRKLNEMKKIGVSLKKAAEQLGEWLFMDSVKYDNLYGGKIKYGLIYNPSTFTDFLVSPPSTPPKAVYVFDNRSLFSK